MCLAYIVIISNWALYTIAGGVLDLPCAALLCPNFVFAEVRIEGSIEEARRDKVPSYTNRKRLVQVVGRMAGHMGIAFHDFHTDEGTILFGR